MPRLVTHSAILAGYALGRQGGCRRRSGRGAGSGGFTTFNTDSYWVRLFAEIGFGDWFRYLTGGLQVASGPLFLIPRTVYAAAVLAGSTMMGAVVAHMFVLDTGIGGTIFPLALLVFIAALVTRRPE